MKVKNGTGADTLTNWCYDSTRCVCNQQDLPFSFISPSLFAGCVRCGVTVLTPCSGSINKNYKQNFCCSNISLFTAGGDTLLVTKLPKVLYRLHHYTITNGVASVGTISLLVSSLELASSAMTVSARPASSRFRTPSPKESQSNTTYWYTKNRFMNV